MMRSFRQKQSYFTGFKPEILLQSLRFFATYLRDRRLYDSKNSRPSFRLSGEDAFPILTDMRSSAGATRDHYFNQDLWAARKIFAHQPTQHLDIGSRIDGFIAHLLVFMPVTVVDIRPLESEVAGLTFIQDNASALATIASNSVESISSLHVAEHFGLGRYTDPVDPEACFQFMSTLERVLAPGGRLYFSVPVGRERVEFNAHRVFAPQTILESFRSLELISFSFVSDEGRLQEDALPVEMPTSEMACGLFEFGKKVAVAGSSLGPAV